MSKLLIGYIPLLVAVIVMVRRLRHGKRFAFPIACLLYCLLAMVIAIYFGAANFSTHDPELVSGEIAESIVSALLLAVFEIPILAVIFWAFKWWQAKKLDKS